MPMDGNVIETPLSSSAAGDCSGTFSIILTTSPMEGRCSGRGATHASATISSSMSLYRSSSTFNTSVVHSSRSTDRTHREAQAHRREPVTAAPFMCASGAGALPLSASRTSTPKLYTSVSCDSRDGARGS